MKKLVSMLLAAAVLFAAGTPLVKAAAPKPIAALAVAGYNDLLGDINFLGGLAERPQLGAMADGLLSLVTQGKGLAGVDKSRPWGAVIQASSEKDVTGFVFVPITDFQAAIKLLELYNTVDAEGEVYKLTPKNHGKTNYVKEHGKWACFSDKAKPLAHVNVDPLALLNGLDKNYIAAGRVFLANAPEELREKLIHNIKKGLAKEAGHKKSDESDDDYARRKKVIEVAGAYIVRVIGDLDQINLGWGLDRSEEKTYLDLSVTAKPGTVTAAEMAMASQAKTNFAGFRVPEAASLWAIAAPIPPAKQEVAASIIDAVRGKFRSEIDKKTPEARREAAKEVSGEIFDMLDKVVKSGRIDAVCTGLLGPKAATGLAAVYVGDGELFDKMLHTLAKAIEEDHPEVAQFVKLDADTAEGHKIHKISIPIPENAENRETVVQYIGEQLDIVIAVGKENVYVAAGRDAGTRLKKAFEASKARGAETVSPVDISYAIKPIAAAIAAVGKPQDRTPRPSWPSPS